MLDLAVRVIEHKPFGGPLRVTLGDDGAEPDLGVQAQAALWVTDLPPRPTAAGECPFPDCRHES